MRSSLRDIYPRDIVSNPIEAARSRMDYAYPVAFASWNDAEHRAIARVIASGQYTQAEEVAAFERELAAYHRVAHCVCVNSGSSANMLAIQALFHVKEHPLERGDTATVSAFAWATTWSPAIHAGLGLDLADVDDTWNVCQTFSYDVDLGIFTSMLGNPIHDIVRVGAERTIEDRCESIGTGSPCWADMTTLSFFYSHQLSAIEGGAILTDNDELAGILRLLRNHGWQRSYENLNAEYAFLIPGYNMRMTEIHAAVGREQLKKLDKMADERRANWKTWAAAAKQWNIEIPTMAENANPFGLTMLLPSEERRQVVAWALRNAGIDCRPCAGGSFRLQPMGKPWNNQATPMADEIHRRGLMLGNAPWDIRNHIDAAARIIGETLR
jgi:CDP-6-deoxy-D-xylo-4-hexulose-3-dehydrase